MKTLIQQEREKAKEYELTETNGCVDLTLDNVAKVETMIRSNSRYADDDDPTKEGTTAYWVVKLKNFYEGDQSKNFEGIISEIVTCIDTHNSTHLNADGVGKVEMTERIVAKQGELREWLHDGKYDLINILTKKTNPDVNDEKHHSRHNFSFATKFCHYVCFYLFDGEKAQDNFSIYDSVVAKNLHFYDDRFKGKEYIFDRNKMENNENYPAEFYKEYQDAIDTIRKDRISRKGFDHLLWYFHK